LVDVVQRMHGRGILLDDFHAGLFGGCGHGTPQVLRLASGAQTQKERNKLADDRRREFDQGRDPKSGA